MWMTNGQKFNIKLTQFAELLGLCSHLDIPTKLHTGRVMAPREMTPMYILNNRFRALRIDGILPHFVVLHRIMRRTLALRIGDLDAIPAYERNLLDALISMSGSMCLITSLMRYGTLLSTLRDLVDLLCISCAMRGSIRM
jgi:hypothetical protein